jgi:parallel beta-helix repeat protein
MSSPDNGKNIISSLNPTLLYLQYLLHNARFAVVAQDGTGNYTTIQAAVAANEKTIFVKEGTYSITSDLVLSGQSLISLAPGKAILSMVDATIELETHTATTAYKFGTSTLTNNSTTVTGVGGTLWDTGANCPSTYTNPWLIGRGMALKVASIQNDTSLLLEDQYRGTTQTMNYFLIDAKNIGSEISGFLITHEPTAPIPCIELSGIGNVVKNNIFRCDRVNTSHAVYVGASAISVAHSCRVENNTINSGVKGVELKNAHACIVSGNTFHNQTGNVISTNTDDGDCWMNKITYNNVIAVSGVAFTLDTDSDYSEISFNKVVNCRNNAVNIDSSDYCNITNNTCDTSATTFSLYSATDCNYLTYSFNKANRDVEVYTNYSTISFNNLATVYVDGDRNTFNCNYFQKAFFLGSYNAVTGNHSNNATAASIEVDGSYCSVTGNTIYKGTDYSIILDGAGFHTCGDNSINDSAGTAIQVEAPNCTVSGNSINSAGAVGFAAINVDAAGHTSSITGNVISTSADHGIYCVASYCIIRNNCSGSTAAAGIYLETGDQCIINGNVCNSNTTYGIFVANTSDRIIITDNICLNNVTAQIQNNGTNTVQADNIVA